MVARLTEALGPVSGAEVGRRPRGLLDYPTDPNTPVWLTSDRRTSLVFERVTNWPEFVAHGIRGTPRHEVNELLTPVLIVSTYPTLQSHPEAKDIGLEASKEHHVADLVLKELYDPAGSNDQ